MAITGNRRDPVKLFLRRLLLLALFIGVLAVCSAVWDVYKKERESRLLREHAEAQMSGLTNQKVHLDGEINRLQTMRGKEETLRENYEMGRAGEGLIIIVESPKSEPVAASSSPIREWVRKLIPFW